MKKVIMLALILALGALSSCGETIKDGVDTAADAGAAVVDTAADAMTVNTGDATTITTEAGDSAVVTPEAGDATIVQ